MAGFTVNEARHGAFLDLQNWIRDHCTQYQDLGAAHRASQKANNKRPGDWRIVRIAPKCFAVVCVQDIPEGLRGLMARKDG